ncbi:TraR/DksA C4-type zinc finger protein [Planctomycetaceae bacterium SH139]
MNLFVDCPDCGERWRFALDQLCCPSCGRPGSSSPELSDAFGELEEDPELWGEGRRCEECQQSIHPERLEVLPDTRHCTRCAQAAVNGESQAEREFCPHCGDLVQTVRRGGGGLAGYVRRCSGCGRT